MFWGLVRYEGGMKILPVAAFAVFLVACASSPESGQAKDGREKAQRIEHRVEPGMNKSEVSNILGEPLGNCRGSVASVETCEVQILTEPARSFFAMPLQGDPKNLGNNNSPPTSWSTTQGSAGYSVYKFVFQRGRLQRWEKSFDRDLRDQAK